MSSVVRRPLACVASRLRCPVCAQPLAPAAGALRCSCGHSLDVAREGYVTLFEAGVGHAFGYDVRMVAARVNVEQAGYFAPLTAALVQTVGGFAGADTSLAPLRRGAIDLTDSSAGGRRDDRITPNSSTRRLACPHRRIL